jgi:hypothetical protein
MMTSRTSLRGGRRAASTERSCPAAPPPRRPAPSKIVIRRF